MSRQEFLERVRRAAEARRAYRVDLREIPPDTGYVGAAQADLCAAVAHEVDAVGGQSHLVDDDRAALAMLDQLFARYAPSVALCWRHEVLSQLGPMASVAGARITEIKVRHHPRQSGQSKYGLSRIYKVMLDLMVVRAIDSFTARPSLWFAVLAIPLALLGLTALRVAIWESGGDPGAMSLSKAGTGVVLLMGSTILFCSGVLGEVIYKLGDVRQRDFSRLTDTVWTTARGGLREGEPAHD